MKQSILPAISVYRNPPVNIKHEDETYFKHEYKKTFPPVYLWKLRNVNVSSHGIVFNNIKIFKPSLVNGSSVPNYSMRYLLSNYLKRRRITLSKHEKYILAFNEWSTGYFHWALDTLPRLTAIKNVIKDCIILLPETTGNAPFINETLKIFSCKGIQTIPENSYAHIPNLVMPEHIAPTGNYNITIMHELKEQFFSFFNNSNLSLGEKIFVSRKKAACRYLINEDEVFEILELYGFRKVFFEDYNIEAQISIMKNAKYFVGIIGSNLVNMMFMQRGSFILQFTQKNNGSDNCYFSLANVFDHNFLYQFCEYVDTRPGAYWNLKVNIEDLKKNLDIIFSKK